MENDIMKLIKQYRQGAIGSANISDPKKANKCQAQMHASYKILRETASGRESIMALMSDTEPSVRCWAAAHSLQWKPNVARRVLETLRDSQGDYSFTAGVTLEEYEKGRLTFDY